jgi:hypothetical protein
MSSKIVNYDKTLGDARKVALGKTFVLFAAFHDAYVGPCLSMLWIWRWKS